MVNSYIKSRNNAPNGFFEAEFIGLEWLREIYEHDTDAVYVAKPYNYTKSSLEMEQIETAAPTIGAATRFGSGLVRMHSNLNYADHTEFNTARSRPSTSAMQTSKRPPTDSHTVLNSEKNTEFNTASSHSFGYSPSEMHYFGPLSDPIAMPTREYDSFWEYFIQGRMTPILNVCLERREMTQNDFEIVLQKLSDFSVKWQFLDNIENYPPARVHGDLWSGNLLWQNDPENPENVRAVLIDPSAHVGIGLEDLALLNLFGCHYYSQIIDSYFSTILPDGSIPTKPDNFSQICKLLNLFPIAGHIAFFGSGYHSQFWSMLKSL